MIKSRGKSRVVTLEQKILLATYALLVIIAFLRSDKGYLQIPIVRRSLCS